ncbi:AfsR/SARP family transcriptional regulator [Streptacidiphilus sp. PAMC 29251]
MRRTAAPQAPTPEPTPASTPATTEADAAQGPAGPTAAEAPYLAFLGRVRAWSGDCPLLTGSPRQQAVLAMLALRAGQEVSCAELVDGLYGEGAHAEDPAGWAAEEVRREAERLRGLFGLSGPFGPFGLFGSPRPLLQPVGDGYLLEIAPDRVDGIAFERLVGAAHALRPGSPADAADLLERAFVLWRGTPLDGVPGPFAVGERIRLQAVHRIAADLWHDLDTAARARAVPLRPHLRSIANRGRGAGC